MDNDQIAALERKMQEEHKKDLDALDRLKRFLPSNGAEHAVGTHAEATQAARPASQFVPEADTPLVYAVRDVMNYDPAVRWTNPKMLKYLTDSGFELKAKQPIYSIGQATKKLDESGQINLLSHGSGKTPNTYRGLTRLEQTALESAGEVEAE